MKYVHLINTIIIGVFASIINICDIDTRYILFSANILGDTFNIFSLTCVLYVKYEQIQKKHNYNEKRAKINCFLSLYMQLVVF